jgi:hypothetical protein
MKNAVFWDIKTLFFIVTAVKTSNRTFWKSSLLFMIHVMLLSEALLVNHQYLKVLRKIKLNAL